MIVTPLSQGEKMSELNFLYNQAYNLKKEEKYEESIKMYRKVLELNPEHYESWNGAGTAYKYLKKTDKAMLCYNRSLEINPNFTPAQWNKQLLLLLLGDYKSGYLKYEWLEPGHPFSGVKKIKDSYPHPVWDGQNLRGTLLLRSQHGLGDVIQFIRYAGIAKMLCDKVIVETHAELKELLESCPYVDEVYTFKDDLPLFDAQMEIIYLPFMFEEKPSTPYLFPKDTKLTEVVKHNKSYPKIGIVWQGNINHPNDKNRSCDLRYYKMLLEYGKIFSLQKGFNNRVPWFDVVTIGSAVKTMNETASAIKNLDLVISVDTSVAHLAGAMEKNVWLILPYIPDWRWGLDKPTTIWYSSMRIFRQPSPGDWDSVFEEIEEALIYKYQYGGN